MNTSIIQARDSQRLYRTIFNQAGVGVAQLNTATGRFLVVNERYCEITGYTANELQQNDFQSITHPDDVKTELENMALLKSGLVREFSMEKRFIRKDGEAIWVILTVSAMWDAGEEPDNHIAVVQDITERKLLDRRKTIISDLLAILNRPNDWRNLINDIVKLLHRFTGFESIGIRLRDGDDYPYYEQIGFNDHFVETERSLCMRSLSGFILRGKDGRPILDCMCGNIINGLTNETWSFFSEGGSFIANHLSELVSKPESPGEILFPRGKCIREKFESLALIPLRTGDDVIGLLQFADHRCNRFSPQEIKMFEELSSFIGVAFHRLLQEKRIRESEVQFRLLFENDLSPRWVYDIETLAFLNVNKAAVDHYGYTRSEFLSMTLKDIRPEGEVDLLMKNVQSDVRDKQHSTGWIHKDKMGKLMDVEITSYATHFNGRNARVVLSSDVTEQLRYLRELRETKNYLQKLLDLANSPIITLNDDLSVISINRSFERISGYTQDELISEGFIALSKSEDQVKIEALLQASMNGEKLENLEIPIRTKDGQIRHIGWNTANILSDDGDKILAILAIGTDLTERKQIEEALSKNEQLLRNIVELLPVGVWVTDKNGVIKSGNKAGNDIWTGTRLVGPEEYGTYKAWWRSNGRSIAPTDWAAYRAIKFGETSLNEEIEIECFDGARKVILNSAIPIVNDRNEITGSVVVNQDITERVEAEDKIRNVNSALVEAKRRAEESDRLKTFLLQNMSHEFRTPMNSILGFSALIGDESTDHDARQLAVRIHDAGNRLMKTLDDILALSQIQAEIRPDQVCPVNLYEEIVGLMPGYMNTAAEKRLKISLNSIEKPVVVMNPTHLVHAINHLLDNAIKFTREGEIMIEVCNQVSNLQSMAMIKISDTGIGIAPDNFSLIFEAFRQASEGYGRSFEGTGLGLTIAKRMIELNGGTIKVESQPGKGSSFTILLPAVTDEAGVQSTVIPRLKPGHGTIHSGIDKGYEIGKIQDKTLIKLLIVEDNTDNIELIKLYLDKNFSCDTANNADAAIRMCHSGVYPIILMDINLGPGKNGMEATREIRRMTGYEHTPIIAITGFTDQNDKEKIFESGCSHYLGKPFSQRALLETVKTALNQSKEKIFQD